jgi:hypothetical protein
MYDFEETRDTTASTERVWAIYTNVSGWPRWNRGIEAASMSGPFESEARGTVTISGMGIAQDVSFHLENVVSMQSFDLVWTVGPFLKTRMSHKLTPTATGCRFVHAYHTGGVMAPFAFLQAIRTRVGAWIDGAHRAACRSRLT